MEGVWEIGGPANYKEHARKLWDNFYIEIMVTKHIHFYHTLNVYILCILLYVKDLVG